MKMTKIMFIIVMMSGTLIAVSAYSWINIWIGLEMNLLAFLPLINTENMKQSSEVSMKYFIVQVSASMYILFSFLLSLIIEGSIYELNSISQVIFSSSVLMKMGAAPFHFWYPSIAQGLSWMNLLILMTWQKIAPMVLIMYNFHINLYFCVIILMSMTISGIKSWNQTSMKKIFALSSINHIGWMMATMMLNQSMWMFYFLIYSLISINLITVFNKYNINSLKDLYMIYNYNKSMKFYFMLNLISLGGIPPFLGFMPKWIVLKMLMENNMYLLAFLMIFLTLLMLFIYMRMIMQPMIFKMSEKKKLFKNYDSMYIHLMNWINISGLVLFTLISNIY